MVAYYDTQEHGRLSVKNIKENNVKRDYQFWKDVYDRTVNDEDFVHLDSGASIQVIDRSLLKEQLNSYYG